MYIKEELSEMKTFKVRVQRVYKTTPEIMSIEEAMQFFPLSNEEYLHLSKKGHELERKGIVTIKHVISYEQSYDTLTTKDPEAYYGEIITCPKCNDLIEIPDYMRPYTELICTCTDTSVLKKSYSSDIAIIYERKDKLKHVL